MSLNDLLRSMLVIVLSSPCSIVAYHPHPPISNQVTLYNHLPNLQAIKDLVLYSKNNRRSPQTAQAPSQASMSNVPQRPRNDTTGTAGTQEVRTQRRQKPFRTGNPSSPHSVANLEVVKQLTVSTHNKYAKAADILAGKGLLPAANFSFVDEWNQNHDWDDIGMDNRMDTRDINGPSTSWSLKSHISGGMDILYYGNMTLGTPPHIVSAEIDTGSADLWVSTAKCVDCDSSSKTPGFSKSQYDTKASTSYADKRDPFHVGYGTGSVCGVLASEKINVNGFKVDQNFGAVFKKTGVFRTTPNRGLLGLAFGTIAASKSPPFFENLLSMRKVRAPYFGVAIGRANKGLGSELCVGCVNKARWRGNLEWVSVSKKSYWIVPLNAFRGSRDGPSTTPPGGPISAAIDTGTSLIYFPSAVAASLYSTIQGAREASDVGPGIWAFPCDAPVNIALAFGGAMFEISQVDFNLGRTKKGSTECVGAVIAMGKDSEFPSGLAIIGVVFLKNWYTVFDYSHGGRVGFAQGV